MKDNARGAIEHAVNVAGAALLGIIKVYADHGDEITNEDSEKIWAHLRRSLEVSTMRSIAMLDIKRNSVGAFSLDNELPKPVTEPLPVVKVSPKLASTPEVASESIALLDAQARQRGENLDGSLRREAITEHPSPPAPQRWVRPTGRLAGTKEPVYENSAPPPPVHELTAAIDKKTGLIKDAGFTD